MSARRELGSAARRFFGLPHLRPEQLEAMEAAVAGRDVLAVMPTGSGKSAIYQVPATLDDGMTVVVSPLIALQDDQIHSLGRSDAPLAVAVNSRQSATENSRSWDAVRRNEAKYVFVAPEQLAKPDVVSRLRHAAVSRIVVDEAHCISAWGHDFRPDYLRLADAMGQLGSPPVIALTATASPVVRREIVERLGLREPVVIATGFDRPNLVLGVERHLSADDKQRAVLEAVQKLGGPTLLYTATRKEAETYAAELASRGRSAAAYHAGLRASERDAVHHRFRDGTCDVVAATSAFGMGIDKPDVRAVLHASVPDSLDTYYQQIGRGGRDGHDAVALLFYRPEDLSLSRFFSARHADEALLHRVYSALHHSTPKRLKHLQAELEVERRTLTAAVNLLQQAAAVTSDRKGLRTTGEAASAAVERAVGVAESGERFDRTRVEMMRGYAETQGCRRQFLLGYFGEQRHDPCGNCDRCHEGSASPDTADDTYGAVQGMPVDTEVLHKEWGQGVVMSTEGDRITVLFQEYGYRTLSVDVIEQTGVLTERRPS
jgi:ATP-dependent DNA helicase RecQ